MFATEVFETIGDRLHDRADDVALFLEGKASFEDWCTWEAFAACRRRQWSVRTHPRYAEVGLTGSRETADLLVTDPARGCNVVVEIGLIHDWSMNRWIANLNRDTGNLDRPLGNGTTPLQVILAASLESPVEVNATWKTWLGMTAIWNRPTSLVRSMSLGTAGEAILKGWVFGGEDDEAELFD